MLQNGEGEWVHDQDQLKTKEVSFYEALYREDNLHHPLYVHRDLFLSIDRVQAEEVRKQFTTENVRVALFDMQPWKAPGVDGVQAGFYQKHWEVVGGDISAEVVRILEGGEMDLRMNKTIICLIPKAEVPKSMPQFRPISLCSVVYKLVTKTIASRLKRLMPLIVGPTQCSFVAGRHITDNIVIAQEVIYTMRSMKGRHGVMAMKVDLEKAYDRVRWAFLYDTLHEARIPTTLIDVIMTCVSTSSMQIMWNGDMTNSFTPSRGLRQGCPLSPYLFVLCMERLAHGIMQSATTGEWKPFEISKNGPFLTHLFFADYLLLFGKAEVATVEAIAYVLDEFCVSSGMKISTAKTTLFFSKNVKSETRISLKELLGVREVDNLGTYLGVPLLHRRVNKNTYVYIHDNMKRKIVNWNAARMSLAGRATLAQSVLNTMPLYAMQTAKIPIGICEDMEKVIRGFLWGKKDDHNRRSIVAWDVVTRPKEDSGLGLRDLQLANNAFGMKVCWELFNNTNTLWGSVICSKYKFDPHSGFDPIAPAVCTPLWRLVCNIWPDMWRNVMWVIGTGKKVKFWTHRWVPNMSTSLSEVVVNIIPDHLMYKIVDCFVDSSGWAWHMFDRLIPPEVVNIIAVTAPPNDLHGDDVACWGPSSTGDFSIKTAYDSLVGSHESRDHLPWKRIWNWYGPQRIKIFLWLLLKNGVLVNAERARRHISANAACSMCGQHT